MSDRYFHLLLATDLNTDNEPVLAKAIELSRLYEAKLSLIHVVESMPLYFGSDLVSPVLPETQELEASLLKLARDKVDEWVDKYGLVKANCHVESGITKMAITEFAEANGVDLIVIGSHSRHGLGHLLGSTASAVLNNARCDVLAVRLKQGE